MGQLDDLNTLQAKPTQNQRCRCCELLDSLDGGDRDILVGLLSDRNIRYDVIAEALRSRNVADLDRSVYSRCARGLCMARRKLRDNAR